MRDSIGLLDQLNTYSDGNIRIDDVHEINGTINYSKDEIIKPFKIRVFFEWFDDENNNSNDENDTEIIKNNESLKINASIKFTQKIE